MKVRLGRRVRGDPKQHASDKAARAQLSSRSRAVGTKPRVLCLEERGLSEQAGQGSFFQLGQAVGGTS